MVASIKKEQEHQVTWTKELRPLTQRDLRKMALLQFRATIWKTLLWLLPYLAFMLFFNRANLQEGGYVLVVMMMGLLLGILPMGMSWKEETYRAMGLTTSAIRKINEYLFYPALGTTLLLAVLSVWVAMPFSSLDAILFLLSYVFTSVLGVVMLYRIAPHNSEVVTDQGKPIFKDNSKVESIRLERDLITKGMLKSIVWAYGLSTVILVGVAWWFLDDDKGDSMLGVFVGIAMIWVVMFALALLGQSLHVWMVLGLQRRTWARTVARCTLPATLGMPVLYVAFGAALAALAEKRDVFGLELGIGHEQMLISFLLTGLAMGALLWGGIMIALLVGFFATEWLHYAAIVFGSMAGGFCFILPNLGLNARVQGEMFNSHWSFDALMIGLVVFGLAIGGAALKFGVPRADICSTKISKTLGFEG